MDTPKPGPQLPQLPTNLDDQAALGGWQNQWNAWIANEAARHKWPWLQPISAETLCEIVQEERQLRADIARGHEQLELATARSDLNALDAHLSATDPKFPAKLALLVPILRPIFRHIPPSKWKALFQEAYSQLKVPAIGSTPGEQREVSEAREALNGIEHRLRVQDPAYEAKKAFLLPIVKPLFEQMPPSKWAATFEETYAGVCLPGDSATGTPSVAPEVEPKMQPTMTGAQELYALLPENPALALLNWREIIKKIHEEFRKTELSSQRDALLQIFTATMDIVAESLGKKNPQLIDEFRSARTQDYKIFIVEECVIAQEVNAKLLCAVTRREIEAGRMATDCTPIIDPPRQVLAPPDSARRQILNAQVDHQRHTSLSGHTSELGSKTVLLYRPRSQPDQIGISKIDPPVAGGAFLLDFTRPLRITRQFLGHQNKWIGTAVEMCVPVIHQGGEGGYETGMHSSDPRFREVRALWKARYPSEKAPPDAEATGFKVVTDFAIQFPDEC